MTSTPDPLDGPFMTAQQLTDSSDEPGYPIAPQPVLQARLAEVREALVAAGIPADTAARRAMGVYSDWLSAISERSTALSLAQYAARKAGR
jgi:hypothetical protein